MKILQFFLNIMLDIMLVLLFQETIKINSRRHSRQTSKIDPTASTQVISELHWQRDTNWQPPEVTNVYNRQGFDHQEGLDTGVATSNLCATLVFENEIHSWTLQTNLLQTLHRKWHTESVRVENP